MSTAGSASGSSAAAMSAGASVGRSPCRFTMISARPAGSTLRKASKIRSEPEAWSARVITARPPAFSTQAAIASESVATATGPMPAACARRMHMHDHRLARDIGERLAGQPGCGHPGRNEDQDFTVGHETWVRWSLKSRESGAETGRREAGDRRARCAKSGPPGSPLEKSGSQKYRGLRLYVLPEARQTGYLCAAATVAGSAAWPIPRLRHSARASLLSVLPRWCPEPEFDGLI